MSFVMARVRAASGLATVVAILPAAWGPTVRGGTGETGMARALDAIRQCARIAWWDGSAVGLHLQGLGGWFGLAEGAQRREECP